MSVVSRGLIVLVLSACSACASGRAPADAANDGDGVGVVGDGTSDSTLTFDLHFDFVSADTLSDSEPNVDTTAIDTEAPSDAFDGLDPGDAFDDLDPGDAFDDLDPGDAFDDLDPGDAFDDLDPGGPLDDTDSIDAIADGGSPDLSDGASGCGTDSAECDPGESGSRLVDCGNCGVETQSRSCDPTTCTWTEWIGGSCDGEGVCGPGETKPGCDHDINGNATACGMQVCNDQCQWGGCELAPGAACLSGMGSSFQCCTPPGGGSGWQFCSSSTCQFFACAAHSCQ